jgi:uncharacterized protein (DUF58 family)
VVWAPPASLDESDPAPLGSVRDAPLGVRDRGAPRRQSAIPEEIRQRHADRLHADRPHAAAHAAAPASAPEKSTRASSRPMSAPEQVLQRLDWTVIRRLDGVLQGDYRSLFRGNGVDLVDLREYQPGDDVRAIDWNVTARMNTPYVREYVEDREITAWFLLDLSPSVDFGTVDTERLKRNVLIDFVATLARLMTRRGNRVGAMLYDSSLERVLPAAGGRDQVLRLIDDLMTQPRLNKAPMTNLAPLLAAGQHAIKRRSLVFIVSDFISVPGWEKPLSVLNRRHEVVAVRLMDPGEMELPDVGPLIIEDAETGEQVYVDTHNAGFRRRFADAVARREEQVSGAFRKSGVSSFSLSTDEEIVRAIVRMAALGRRRGR